MSGKAPTLAELEATNPAAKEWLDGAFGRRPDEVAASVVLVAEENGWWTTRAFRWLMGTYESEAMANERAERLRADVAAALKAGGVP